MTPEQITQANALIDEAIKIAADKRASIFVDYSLVMCETRFVEHGSKVLFDNDGGVGELFDGLIDSLKMFGLHFCLTQIDGQLVVFALSTKSFDHGIAVFEAIAKRILGLDTVRDIRLHNGPMYTIDTRIETLEGCLEDLDDEAFAGRFYEFYNSVELTF